MTQTISQRRELRRGCARWRHDVRRPTNAVSKPACPLAADALCGAGERLSRWIEKAIEERGTWLILLVGALTFFWLRSNGYLP